MHNKSFYSFMLCLLLVFALAASQGCGGGNSGNSLSGESGGNGSVVIGGDTILENDGFDTNGNGMPDFFDFDGVPLIHAQGSSALSVNAQVPSLIFFDKLKETDAESPDVISVNLQAGTEYTFEFSRNLADPIEAVAPVIEILDPVSKEPVPYFFSESEAALPYDRIQLTAYPEEQPSLICLTFKPSVTGEYVVRISGINTSTIAEESDDDYIPNDMTDEFYDMIVDAIGQEETDSLDKLYGDGETETEPETTDDNSCVLFIYKELRNERGEPGYYTRFKFSDGYGNTTDTLNINDIIELRKIYLKFGPDYLKEHYGKNAHEDYYDELTDEELEELFAWFIFMQEYNGLYDIEPADSDAEISSASLVRPSAQKKPLSSTKSNIPTTISGVQYDGQYELGNGFFGVTGYPAKGSAIQSFTPPVPETKRVSSYYRASFVSSQQDYEKLSKTTAGASFSMNGFGLKANLSSMSNYKFGLTSTTFVIHYEETESTPRVLSNKNYKLTQGAAEELAKGAENFRNSYGDYFVAGYTYGGTYDAFISITTETSEQLTEIKAKLSASYQSLDKTSPQGSANIANETRELLKKYNASVSIEIKTSGSNASDPDIQAITPKHGKNNVDSIGDVVAEFFKFRSVLSKQKPSEFAPVSVTLRRYSLLSPVLRKMNSEKDDGTVPIAPETAVVIQRFNRSLITLGAYYNVIAELDNSKIDATVRDSYYDRYQNIITTITSDPNFYSNSAKVKSTESSMKALAKELKDLGDRYTFYRMLVASQKREREMYTKYNEQEDDASANDTTYQPFGGYKGGSTGYSEFFVSSAVTSDIKKGKNVELNGVQSYKAAGRRYWGTVDHNMDNVQPSYTAATTDGSSEAAFCYVSVTAENYDTDRHRRFSNYPVAGKSRLDFDFTSGYSRWATWTVRYQTMHFTREKYPFFGLER